MKSFDNVYSSEMGSYKILEGKMLNLNNFKVDYKTNPIGIDALNPSFSWILESDKDNTLQRQYQIIVKENDAVVWDTDLQESDQSTHVQYSGLPLKPVTRYDIEVFVKDSHDESAEITGTFETGLLSYENFHGDWITHSFDDEESCPVFVFEFPIHKKIKTARIYASALGIYEIDMNGEKVGDQFFAPGWTSYHNRIQYQTYDVTNHLMDNNQLEITVANGWYKGLFGYDGRSNHYGSILGIIADIHLTYEDGSVEVFKTDESWKCKAGKTRFSEIYLGETIDRTFDSTELFPVKLLDYKKSILVGQDSEPVTVIEQLKPLKKIISPKGELILDFGQNLVGVIEFQTNQPEGSEVIIRHAEVLDKEGNFYTENLRKAVSVDRFICSGKSEVFRPRFTFHGFRYISIEGIEDVNVADFTACVLHTDMKKTGEFYCSHEGLTKLQKNIEWGQKGNFLDIPTDCNQRDERLGWTGDAQVFSRTAAFNYDVASFFKKWLKDLALEQTEKFGVPRIVPNIMGEHPGAAGWSDAATIIPWDLYQVYGDKQILKDQYSSMKSWVDYIYNRTNGTYLWQTDHQYGDWVALDKQEDLTDLAGSTDKYMIATAYFAKSTSILAAAAKVLGYLEDAEFYDSLYEKIIDAFNDEYITKTGRLVSETQTACVVALHFNLAKEKDRPRILEILTENLQMRKNHLSTGFVGTPYLCHALSDNGEHELAGKVVLQDDYPSWLYSVKMGATTIWERWNSMKPDGSFDESGMNSFNHYAYGSIGDWMYQKLAGIQILEPGYKKSLIAPKFIKGITEVKAKLETVYGTLSSAWKCENGMISVEIEIPANTTALIRLPEKETEFELGSGIYFYEYETNTDLRIEKYNMETTLGEIMANPLAVSIIEERAPELISHPMIHHSFKFTLSELTSRMKEEHVRMYEEILLEMNRNEA